MVSKRSPRPEVSSASLKRSFEREKVVQKPPYSLSNTSVMPVKPALRQQRAIKPALRRAARMHALDHGAVLRRHQPRRLGAGDAERMHGLLRREPQRRRGAGRRREHADGRAGMPALADMLGPHAEADPRPDLVAGDRGAQEIASAHARPHFDDREQRRQRHRADMEHAGTMDVVELEALHQRAVDERRMRRGQPPCRCPTPRRRAWCRPPRASSTGFRLHGRPVPNMAQPSEVEDQELDPRDHLGGNLLIGEPGDEVGDAAGLRIVG